MIPDVQDAQMPQAHGCAGAAVLRQCRRRNEASSAIELERHAQTRVHGERRLNIRHPGGGRGPDKNAARRPRLAWIPAYAGMTNFHR